MSKVDAAVLFRVAKRAKLPIRMKGGHVIVTLPDGGRPIVFAHPARNTGGHVHQQMVKRFRDAGLLEGRKSA